MKAFSLFFSIMFCLSLKAQTNSYEFKSAVPPGSPDIKVLPAAFHGQYRNEQTGTVIELNEQGVSMIATITSYITKEQFRESSRYQVRDGYIFGVHPTDSFPCIYEEEKYFFGMRQRIPLSDASKGNILKKMDERTYVINFKEASGYVPALLILKGNELQLQHFDYSSETRIFDSVKQKNTLSAGSMNTVLLDPDSKEWTELMKQQIFDQGNSYRKVQGKE